jgi:DNA-binding CsgD family transcriptional regulator
VSSSSPDQDRTRASSAREDDPNPFEELVAEAAARLADAGPREFDPALEGILESVGRFLGAERSIVFRHTGNAKESLPPRNAWAVEPATLAAMEGRHPELDVPWIAGWVRSRGSIVAGPGLRGLPEDAPELPGWLERLGITSGAAVSFLVEGRPSGILVVDTVGAPREFSALDVERLRVIADMIGSTLERVRAEERLESLERSASASPTADPGPSPLTERQRQVLAGLARGLSAKEVAAELAISRKTVEYHKYRMMRELGVGTSAQLLRYAVRNGIGEE